MRDELLAVYEGENAPYIIKTRELISTPGVTDVHITEGENVWFRCAGEMKETDAFVPSEGVMMLSSSVFKLGSWDRGNRACDFEGKRLRLRFSRSRHRAQLFVRVLPNDPPDIESLGGKKILSEMLPDILSPGLFLVSGATGSGKSTFLSSYLQFLIDNYPIHIVTVEDPIEYVLKNKKGKVSQRELPDDASSYDTAVRDSLREDPDVLLIGEMRDSQTAVAALAAAETGHLVLGTVHASNPIGVIERLSGLMQDAQDSQIRLAFALCGVIHLSLRIQNGAAERKCLYLSVDAETSGCIARKNLKELANKVKADFLKNVF